jgi:peptidoglycan/xylan/chitin deacetylase (PgdA/CDA1 family)
MSEYARHWKEAAPQPEGAPQRARGVIRSVFLSLKSRLCITRQRQGVTLLYCHYVFDDQRTRFEGLVRRLKTLGTFVDTGACLDMAEGRRRIDARYFHLSFDDGFRNIFVNAVPVLNTLSVPALFFVPTAFVDADRLLAQAYCHTIDYRAMIEMIRWADLREMVSAGFEVGSHTRSHARLSAISNRPEILEREIQGSKQDLEAQLGGPCRYISWPYGERRDVDTISLKMIQRAGYRGCFSAVRGSVRPGHTDVFRMPRHHFEVQWPFSHVRYFALSTGEQQSPAGPISNCTRRNGLGVR